MKSCCEHHRFKYQKQKPAASRLKVIACLIAIFICHGIVSTMDYEDELAAQAYSSPTQTAQGGNTQ